MAAAQLGVFESFERCLADGAFLDRFYELFLASSADVAAKFQGTDFERQKAVLRESLQSMLLATEMGGMLKVHLKQIADRHSRKDRDIPAHLYDLWEDCLLRAVSEHDPEFDSGLERQWREALRPGIEFMRSRY